MLNLRAVWRLSGSLASRIFRRDSSTKCVTLFEGDGIGPEISSAVVKIFEAAQVPITWDRVSVKIIKTPDGKVTIPEEVFTSMKENKIGLKGEFVFLCSNHEESVWVLVRVPYRNVCVLI